MGKRCLLMCVFLVAVSIGFAQNQLVMIKGEKVLAVYKEGEDITLKLKKQNQFKTGYLIKVEDFFIVTNHDTIPLINIDKINLKQKSYGTRLNVFGTTLATIGLGYFLIDEFNSILVKKQGFDESEAAWKPAVILVGVGLPMMLIKKKKHHVGWKYKLRAASPGSPFYKY